MSFIAQLQEAVELAFEAAGDLVQTVQVRRRTLGSYDVQTHSAPETTTDYPFEAAVTDDEIKMGDDGRVVGRIRSLIMRPGDIDPRTDDHVVIGAEVCRIIATAPIKPSTTVLAWEIKVLG